MAEIQIEVDVPAQIRGGTVLPADVHRPGGTGPWPVPPSRLPYGRHTPIVAIGLAPLAAAERGFMAVIQDTRGRGSSPRGSGSRGRTRRATVTTPCGGPLSFPVRTAPSVRYVRRQLLRQHPQWRAALSKPPELKAIAPLITWSDPGDGLWTRGGAIELGITEPWSLMHGAGTLMRRHRTDLDGLVSGITGLVQDLDGLASSGYAELPAGHFPAFGGRVHDMQLDRFQRTLGNGGALEPDTGNVPLSVMGVNSGARRRNGPCHGPWTQTSTCARTDA